ncbi:MAG TPA: hypothetical protein VF285_05315 [Castellaniella sp.]|uniref:hypothetical protein n=1 Tax=Castellaniella sp. TaxID=1955812 RepID=UPI002EDCDE7A
MKISRKLTAAPLVLVAALGLAMSGTMMTANAATSQKTEMSHAMNWFGGPVYEGAPALEATAALVAAGGGAKNFTFDKALVSMLGEKTVNAEVAKLTKQYGEKDVKGFIAGMTFAINDGLKRATEAGVKLPAAPADLKGVKLAKTLVAAGTAPDGAFWAGYLFDKAISHKLHNQVMADIDVKFGHGADENTHKILNQAMYDVAHALGEKNVKLASLH